MSKLILKSKLIFILGIAGILAACGGGGGSGSAPAAAQPSAQPPAQSSSAIPLNNANITLNTDYGDFLIQAASGVNVTIPSSSTFNVVDFSQNQAASAVDIAGDYNKLIFRAGTSVSSLSVTGNYNTLWVPASAPIAVSGIPDTTTFWKTYTP